MASISSSLPQFEQASAPLPSQIRTQTLPADCSHHRARVNQIGKEYFSPTDSSSALSSLSSLSGGGNSSSAPFLDMSDRSININSGNTTVSGRGNKDSDDNNMGTAAKVAIFVAAGAIFIGLMSKIGTWTRQINEAIDSSQRIRNMPSDLTNEVVDMNKRIIRSNGTKLSLAFVGVACTIGAIAAAAFGSYNLLWAAAIGGLLTVGVSVMLWASGQLDTAKRIEAFYESARTMLPAAA